MESVKRYTQSFVRLLCDLVAPQYCIGCKTKGSVLCNICLSHLRLAERETDSTIHALFDYRDPIVKKAMWRLKYYRGRIIGTILGKVLYERMLEDIASLKILVRAQPLLVLPVPIHHSKRKIRGYNQAEVIARSFCECNSQILELITNIITKQHNGLPQARLHNRHARLKNIKGSFNLRNSHLLSGRTVIIIDDVTTTGGTLTEIMKLCKKAHAKKVIGLAVAH